MKNDETDQILRDKPLMRAIRRGRKQAAEGKLIPIEAVSNAPKIKSDGYDRFIISWACHPFGGRGMVIGKAGVHQTAVRRITRKTDRKGALRFAKKWNLKLPLAGE